MLRLFDLSLILAHHQRFCHKKVYFHARSNLGVHGKALLPSYLYVLTSKSLSYEKIRSTALAVPLIAIISTPSPFSASIPSNHPIPHTSCQILYLIAIRSYLLQHTYSGDAMTDAPCSKTALS